MGTSKRPGEATGEYATSVEIETPELMGSWREADNWHCVAGSVSLKRAQKKLLAKVQNKVFFSVIYLNIDKRNQSIKM